jgi:asparagine synthase (glutamine-hydrolysing)
MCGIAGFLQEVTAAEAERRLDTMALAMAHRGPDDQGIEVSGTAAGLVAGLCSRRLAVQDCSELGHQPMVSPRTGNVLAFNGEIYNTGELRASLEELDLRFRGESDTELVLGGYDVWGSGVFERLRGMFGLAIWDPRDEALVLCRDRLGIKPLYVADRGGRLTFASELRALTASGFVPREISVPAAASFLALGAVQEPESGLAGVEQLPPGSFGRWQRGSFTVEPYWSLEEAFERRNGFGESREDAVRTLRALLEEAVAGHLVSDVPLGVFLSGGIDSSALVALVSEVSSKPPRTVSVTFPQAEYSEAPMMELVKERYRTEHTEIHLSDEKVLEKVPAALDAMDHPSFDGVNTFIVSELARIEAGLTVSLSGLGGDELFGGYDTFSIVPRLNRLRASLPRPLARAAAAVVGAPVRLDDRRAKLARWLRQSDIDGSAYLLRRELFAPGAAADLLPQAPARRVSPGELASGGDANDVSYLELSVYMRNVLLRDSDVMGMANSLEIRVPFLDHKVVELAASMPSEWKSPNGGPPKALLVDALGDLLPSEIVNRPKMGFTLPFGHWLRGPLRRDAEEVLLGSGSSGGVSDLLDDAAVERVWKGFLGGSVSWHRPWALYVLRRWAARLADG